jgi:hypothetical protein
MNNLKSFFSIIIYFFIIHCLSPGVHAGEVPWSYENYSTSIAVGDDFLINLYDSDSASGPPLPISAHASWESIVYPGWEMNAYSGISAATMYIECNPLRCTGKNTFTGNYIADNPFFLYEYNYESPYFVPYSIEVINVTTATSLFLFHTAYSDSDIFYIPTPVGDEIRVHISMVMPEHISGLDATLNYSMSTTPVVPEPVSSTLFIIGGAALGFRRLRKKFKKEVIFRS